MSDETLSYDEAAAAAVNGSDGTAGGNTSGTLEQPDINNGASSAGQAWDGSSFAIKFRDREVVPQSQDQLKTWASQGYGYSQRVAELKTREDQINQLEQELGPYKKLTEAFDSNPDFKQKIIQPVNIRSFYFYHCITYSTEVRYHPLISIIANGVVHNNSTFYKITQSSIPNFS